MQGTISTMRYYMVQCSDNVVNTFILGTWLPLIKGSQFRRSGIWASHKLFTTSVPKVWTQQILFKTKVIKIILVFVFLVLLLFVWMILLQVSTWDCRCRRCRKCNRCMVRIMWCLLPKRKIWEFGRKVVMVSLLQFLDGIGWYRYCSWAMVV